VASSAMRLHDAQGHRLYLTAGERDAFRTAADASPRVTRTFGLTLFYTGCRISEALELTADRVDFRDRSLTFRSLKKRRQHVYRSVPVPEAFLDVLNLVHGIREGHAKGRLWGWTRKTGYNHITAVMTKAALSGPQATPKGLRHGYAVACIEKGIPLNIVQELLGHAQMTTTAIYAHAVGAERRSIVARLWEA
jgi:integrase/recombinase XerD